MRSFKRRVASLTATLSFTAMKKFILTSGHGDKRLTGVPGLIIFWLYVPLIYKVLDWFSISFFRRCAFHFWSSAGKLVKIERFVRLISAKNMRGGQNLSPPPRAAAMPKWYPIPETAIYCVRSHCDRVWCSQTDPDNFSIVLKLLPWITTFGCDVIDRFLTSSKYLIFFFGGKESIFRKVRS